MGILIFQNLDVMGVKPLSSTHTRVLCTGTRGRHVRSLPRHGLPGRASHAAGRRTHALPYSLPDSLPDFLFFVSARTIKRHHHLGKAKSRFLANLGSHEFSAGTLCHCSDGFGTAKDSDSEPGRTGSGSTVTDSEKPVQVGARERFGHERQTLRLQN